MSNESADHVDDTRGTPEGEAVDVPPPRVVYVDGKGLVSPEHADSVSQQGFYGLRLDDGRLLLEPVELLHLLERKRIAVVDPAGCLMSAKDIVNDRLPHDPDLWTRYLVFRDLRSRGYAVRQGFGKGIDFRVYSRGERPGTTTARQLVYVLKEGIPISLVDLDRATETASAARKKLVFALVDQNGEVSYYQVAQTVLPNRSGAV